jgi:hypothetical protein
VSRDDDIRTSFVVTLSAGRLAVAPLIERVA